MNITIIIILITSLISILAFSNPDLHYKLRFDPYLIRHKKQYWRFITHATVHANYIHLLMNMFVFWSFGRAVEQYFHMIMGYKAAFYYLLLYLGGIVLSATPSYGKNKNNAYYSAVGASGAVSAVVFAAIVFNPLAPLRIMFIPINIPAIIFGTLYLIYSAWMSKKPDTHIGHDAHFWGAIFGFAFTIIAIPGALRIFLQQLGL